MVRDDGDDRGKGRLCDTHGFRPGQMGFEPIPVLGVATGVGPEGVHEDAGVRKEH